MTSGRAARAVVAVIAVGGIALATPTAVAATSTGPSTTVEPYVLPVAEGVDITSLLTVGDKPADNGYRMVGIPDGLGAYRQGRDLVVFENHELRETVGVVRAHGQLGAFVSRFVIDARTGRVKSGSDLIRKVRYWDYPAGTYAAAPVAPEGATVGHTLAFSRFCSATLTAPGQLFNRHTGKGYAGQLFFTNEESGDEGRTFAVTTKGRATQLPRLGLASWENTVPANNRSDTTVVIGNEDGSRGQLRAYVGTKTHDGSAVAKAGLTNGTLHVITVEGVADATSSPAYGKGVSRPFQLTPVDWNKNGADQNTDAEAVGTTLNRIEDGSFDPDNRNDYYFLTTEGGDTTPDPSEPATTRDGGGLWRLSFHDVDKPQLGGTLTLLLDGSEAPYLNKPDNLTVDREGNLLIQEDPGTNDHLARILAYRLADGAIGVLAQFDRDLFASDQPGFITNDEEASGIIALTEGHFLFDAQVHVATGDPETVEKGQLLSMTVDDWDDVYGSHGPHRRP